MKYLCLAYEAEQDLKSLSREDWLALRQETLDYVAALRERGELLDTQAYKARPAAPGLPACATANVRPTAPFAETKEQISGYFLIEARDDEHALGSPPTGRPPASAVSKCDPSRSSCAKKDVTERTPPCPPLYPMKSPRPRRRAASWLGLAVLMLPTVLLALDMTVLHLAAPRLSADRRNPPVINCCGSWISTAS